MNRLEVRIVWLALGILGGALVVLFTSGCSTVDGLGALMQGMGNDTRDMAQGTRNKLSERADR